MSFGPLINDAGMRLQPPAGGGARGRARPGCRVLVIDNYDSFTFNLVQYLLELGATVDIYRNDAVSAAAVLADRPSHVLLSPGPGTPAESGVCQELCRALGPAGVPTLGVCLGHQTLCEVHGARVERAARVMHGKRSPVVHDGVGLFAGVPTPMSVTRYHSLIVAEDTLPRELLATAHTDAGELMAVRHREQPLWGVQFHPESIFSEHGHAMLRNFLNLSGETSS